MYYNWLLEINAKKCETILFINNLDSKSKATKKKKKKKWRNFRITDTENDTTIDIPHKRNVKYLGVTLDDRLIFSEHLKIQLNKASNVFKSLHNLFYNTHLERIFILCVIRPILTYACPIWFNVSPCQMELLKKFERKCLKICLRYYREAEHNYKYRIKNSKVYKLAQTIRIDIFIIKLIRDHIKSAMKNNNNLIKGPYYPKDLYHIEALKTGLIPPDAFLFMDLNGYIVNDLAKPIFYHISRDNRNKKVLYNPKKVRLHDLTYDSSLNKLDIDTINKFRYFNKK